MISGSDLSFVFVFFFRHSYDIYLEGQWNSRIVQTRVCSLYNIFDKNNVLTKTEKTLYSNATFLLDHGRDFKIDGFILVLICYALLRRFFKRWTICKDIQLGTGRGAFFLHYFPLLDMLLKVDVRCRPSNVNIFSRTTWSISNRFGM